MFAWMFSNSFYRLVQQLSSPAVLVFLSPSPLLIFILLLEFFTSSLVALKIRSPEYGSFIIAQVRTSVLYNSTFMGKIFINSLEI